MHASPLEGRPERDPPAARELRAQLIAHLAETGEVHDPRVEEALRSTPRHLFVPAGESLYAAYANEPLPIGYQQTISQPAVVAMMTEALELSGSERVLEIGTGSGYQAAVLSRLAREVYSIELVPQLAESAAARLRELGYANVHVRQGDGHLGWPEHAPFDSIIVTAAAESVPGSWTDQLAEGGILVAPVGRDFMQSLLKYRKRDGRLTHEDLGWVAFVPCRHAAPGGDAACVTFLQWALPRLHLRWRGFRKVRKLVCKRVLRRARELGLEGFDAYRTRLEASPGEWEKLDELCRIPISRFYRDRGVFDSIRGEILPDLATRALARGANRLRAWSVGCASGEEPYSLSMIWRLDVGRRFPSLALDIVATDADGTMLERARRGRYGAGSLRLLPPEWRSLAFQDADGLSCLRDELREGVAFRREDVRTTMPEGRFDLILCRNLVFTYFEPALEQAVATRIVERLVDRGALVVGCHERPPDLEELTPVPGVRCAYVRSGCASALSAPSPSAAVALGGQAGTLPTGPAACELGRSP